jgi:hypothetical protein
LPIDLPPRSAGDGRNNAIVGAIPGPLPPFPGPFPVTTLIAQWMILLGEAGAVILTLYLIGWAVWRIYLLIKRRWF